MWEISNKWGGGGEVGGGRGGEEGGRMGGDEGGAGDRGWGDLSPHHMVNTCAAKSAWNPGKLTKSGFFGGWADGWGVYWPPKRASLGSDSGLDLAISRFTNSLALEQLKLSGQYPLLLCEAAAPLCGSPKGQGQPRHCAGAAQALRSVPLPPL